MNKRKIKLNKSKIFLLGFLVCIFFYASTLIMGNFVKLYVVSEEKHDIAIKVNAKVRSDLNSNSDLLETYLTDEEINLFEKKKSVNIKKDNKIFSAYVYKIYYNKNQNLIKFKINQKNMVKASTNEQEFDIIYSKTYTYKIPEKSIVVKDKMKGVYVLNEESKHTNFVQIGKILDTKEGYAYVDKVAESSSNDISVNKNVKNFDRIILKPNFINTNIKIY
ncbi:MAG: hypothetical protein LBR30_07200 [Clostridioides sp.]|nr:hypothetical protein [Clostridioides sp.]